MAATRKKRKSPWNRAAPSDSSHKSLTPGRKAAAKARAKRAGRPYPNLVDNMAAAGSRKRKKSSSKRKNSSRGRKKST